MYFGRSNLGLSIILWNNVQKAQTNTPCLESPNDPAKNPQIIKPTDNINKTLYKMKSKSVVVLYFDTLWWNVADGSTALIVLPL